MNKAKMTGFFENKKRFEKTGKIGTLKTRLNGENLDRVELNVVGKSVDEIDEIIDLLHHAKLCFIK